MITMKDIAKETGVSVVTVSNTLRGKDNVSPDTAKRILEVADRLGYRVNASNLAARSLRMRGTRNYRKAKPVIGVAVFEFDNPQPAQMAAAISRAAGARGCQTMFQQTLSTAENEYSIIEDIANQYCDGLILSSANLPVEDILRFTKRRPTVLLDDARPQDTMDRVLSPSEAGSADAIQYLLGRGYERIGIIGDPLPDLSAPECLYSVGARRLKGCAEAFGRAGKTLAEEQCVDCEWTWQASREVVPRMGDSIRRFDALYCLTDNIALGVIKGLHDLGVSVPEDIAVMGFDGCSLDECFIPGLTTVAMDMDQMAAMVVDYALERVNGQASAAVKGRELIVDHHLEIRESA